MTPLDLLLSATTVALILAAAALGTAGRVGAVRALALLLAANAALVARGLAWTLPTLTSLQTPAATVGALALFALSPPLLALAVVRAGTHGPLRQRDAVVALPAAVVLAVFGTRTALIGAPVLPGGVEVAYLVGLNVVALASFGVAVQAIDALPDRLMRTGAAVVAVFVIHWLWSTASWVASIAGASRPLIQLLQALSVGTLLAFGIGAAWFGLRRLPAALPAPPPPPDPEAERSDARLAARVRDAVEGKRRYLDPELTVDTLAAELREPTRDVSRVLNARLGGGFHEVVGRLRVAEAQRLLLSEPDATVLDILYRSGFNSKSAFHRAFRQHIGTTPSAFRRDPESVAPVTTWGDGMRGGGVPGVPLPAGGRRDAP